MEQVKQFKVSSFSDSTGKKLKLQNMGEHGKKWPLETSENPERNSLLTVYGEST